MFLENGVSLEELPLSKRHRDYCLDWLQQHNKIDKESYLKESDDIDFEKIDFSNYPVCVYKRSKLWVEYDSSVDAYLLWRS